MKITGRKAAEAAGVSYESFLGGYAAEGVWRAQY